MVDYPTPRSAVTHPDDARPDAQAFGPGFLTPAARDDRSTAGTAGSDLGSRYRAVIDWILAGEPGGIVPLGVADASEATATRPATAAPSP